jgi:hypothetical protein
VVDCLLDMYLTDAALVFRAVTDAGMLQCPSNGATVFAMRHRKKLPKLNRPADQRKALLRSLTTEILRHGKITTTKVGRGVGSCGPPDRSAAKG